MVVLMGSIAEEFVVLSRCSLSQSIPHSKVCCSRMLNVSQCEAKVTPSALFHTYDQKLRGPMPRSDNRLER